MNMATPPPPAAFRAPPLAQAGGRGMEKVGGAQDQRVGSNADEGLSSRVSYLNSWVELLLISFPEECGLLQFRTRKICVSIIICFFLVVN